MTGDAAGFVDPSSGTVLLASEQWSLAGEQARASSLLEASLFRRPRDYQST